MSTVRKFASSVTQVIAPESSRNSMKRACCSPSDLFQHRSYEFNRAARINRAEISRSYHDEFFFEHPWSVSFKWLRLLW